MQTRRATPKRKLAKKTWDKFYKMHIADLPEWVVLRICEGTNATIITANIYDPYRRKA